MVDGEIIVMGCDSSRTEEFFVPPSLLRSMKRNLRKQPSEAPLPKPSVEALLSTVCFFVSRVAISSPLLFLSFFLSLAFPKLLRSRGGGTVDQGGLQYTIQVRSVSPPVVLLGCFFASFFFSALLGPRLAPYLMLIGVLRSIFLPDDGQNGKRFFCNPRDCERLSFISRKIAFRMSRVFRFS